MFTEWFGAAIARWESANGVRLGPRGLQRMMTRAGYPVSAGYLSMLYTGHRRHPSQALIEALAAVLGVSTAGLPTAGTSGSDAPNGSTTPSSNHSPRSDENPSGNTTK
ncbi:transcriptional regulator [Nocardia miyunensis]|uniref:transcriptional regulator n=1 Tax=Nocardia miyunensis TaxID=282684 RepID=UPI00083551A1|nr:transcriptional regulator [Nocardia miyunensis]